MIQRYAEDTLEGILHRLVSNTEDGSLLAAVKSVCEKFQWNINKQQDATEFYMRYSFDAFLSENSLSTGFTERCLVSVANVPELLLLKVPCTQSLRFQFVPTFPEVI